MADQPKAQTRNAAAAANAPAAHAAHAASAGPAAHAAPAADIIARASAEYRIKRYIMVVILAGTGAWFGYDGFFGWPNENQRVADTKRQIKEAQNANNEKRIKELDFELTKLKEHTDTDLMFQKVLCIVLPALGFGVLAFSLHNSRGAYRLRGGVLEVPGHPPVPLDAIRAIDKTYWDRKGIAYLDYELANKKTGTLRLDDFIYQRKQTDDIFAKVEEFTGTAEKESPAAKK